jgi:dephospho-CoA kinase
VLKIGLTGGIGCGKSTVSRLFEQLGAPIIDADEVSHQLVQIGQPALETIRCVFGSEMLLENGALNRVGLKNLIFENLLAKKQLEAILHPLIFQEISNQIAVLTASYCIVSVPLLFETHSESLVNRILVVNCDVETQIERVTKRDNLPLKQIQSILAIQVSAAFRQNHADDIIENSKNNTTLAEQVKKLHNFYLSLSPL